MENNLLDFLKNSSKTRDRFAAISDLQDNEETVSFHPGNTEQELI